jgi:hypothetical protein
MYNKRMACLDLASPVSNRGSQEEGDMSKIKRSGFAPRKLNCAGVLNVVASVSCVVLSRQLISTVAAVVGLASIAVIAITITWSAIASPAGPVVMTKADFDRSFADTAAAVRPAAAVRTKADFDRTFADATAAARPAYASDVQREELRRIGRKLLRAAERPVAAQ